MKRIINRILVVVLLVSLIFPVVPQSASSSSLTHNEMSAITGGLLAVDCSALASAVEAFCYIAGGSSLTCKAAWGGAYLVCLLAKVII